MGKAEELRETAAHFREVGFTDGNSGAYYFARTLEAIADLHDRLGVHCGRCSSLYSLVEDGGWRALVCSGCGHVSGCRCNSGGDALKACVDTHGVPLRDREITDGKG